MAEWMNDMLARLTPALAIEAGVLLLLLLVAGALNYRLQHAAQARTRMSGLRQIAFPLLGVLLLYGMRFFAHHFGWHLHLTNVVVQMLWAMAGIRMVVFAVQRAFPGAQWLRSFGRNIALVVWCGVALDIIGLLSELTEWLDSFVLPLGKHPVSLLSVLQGLASVAGALLFALWLGGVIEGRLQRLEGMDSSLRAVLSRVAKAVLILVSILIGMELVGLDITTLSVFGGALGVGLGFGMQKIASNYISGFIILLDRSIRIGNLIQVGTERGEVRQITTRYTVLRALSGQHFLVPNENLVGNVVQNDTFADPRARVAVRVQVAYGTDIERVLPLLEQLPRAEERVLADPAPQAYLVSFDDSGITLELGFWVADPQNGSLGLQSNVNRAILKLFRAEGIEIPFPQREVRVLNPAS